MHPAFGKNFADLSVSLCCLRPLLQGAIHAPGAQVLFFLGSVVKRFKGPADLVRECA